MLVPGQETEQSCIWMSGISIFPFFFAVIFRPIGFLKCYDGVVYNCFSFNFIYIHWNIHIYEKELIIRCGPCNLLVSFCTSFFGHLNGLLNDDNF